MEKIIPFIEERKELLRSQMGSRINDHSNGLFVMTIRTIAPLIKTNVSE